MRVLFITRKYPPAIGGMEKLSYQLIAEMKCWVEVEAITWGGSQKWLPGFFVWAFIRAGWILLTKPVDAVHIGDPVLAPLGVSLRYLGRIPVFVTAHGLDLTFANRFYQGMIRFCLKRLDGVVCISEYSYSECLKRGVSPARCTVITPGVQDAGPIISRDESRKILEGKLGISLGGRPVVLSVGRLVKRKGLAWFVREVMPKLVEANEDILFVVCGDGPMRKSIEAEIKAGRLEAHVVLLGAVDAQILRAAYFGADVFVMPNIVVPGDPEGFGLVVLEARLAGTPVVASDLEGIRDAMAEKGSGVLVESGNAAGFLQAILRVLNGQADLRPREQIRQQVAEKGSWRSAGEKYFDAFRRWMGLPGVTSRGILSKGHD